MLPNPETNKNPIWPSSGHFWKWYHWESIRFYPYTQVMCFWSLVWILKARIQSHNKVSISNSKFYFQQNTTMEQYCNGGYFSETSLRSRIPPARPRDPVIHIKPQAPKARGYCYCPCCLIRIQVRNKEQSLSPEPRLNGECWDTVTLAQSALNWSG